MAFFDWSDEYSVNIKEIDAQHRQIIDVLNELYENMLNGKGAEVLEQILAKMVEYAETHFATEEDYMKKHIYPEYAEHKKSHESFVDKTNDLINRSQKNPTVLSIETGKFLKSWWAQHIKGTDMLYGPYLNDKGVY